VTVPPNVASASATAVDDRRRRTDRAAFGRRPCAPWARGWRLDVPVLDHRTSAAVGSRYSTNVVVTAFPSSSYTRCSSTRRRWPGRSTGDLPRRRFGGCPRHMPRRHAGRLLVVRTAFDHNCYFFLTISSRGDARSRPEAGAFAFSGVGSHGYVLHVCHYSAEGGPGCETVVVGASMGSGAPSHWARPTRCRCSAARSASRAPRGCSPRAGPGALAIEWRRHRRTACARHRRGREPGSAASTPSCTRRRLGHWLELIAPTLPPGDACSTRTSPARRASPPRRCLHLAVTSGTVAFLSSVSACLTPPWPGLGAYIVSKAALDKLVEAWQAEHANIASRASWLADCAGGEGDRAHGVQRGWIRAGQELAPVWCRAATSAAR